MAEEYGALPEPPSGAGPGSGLDQTLADGVAHQARGLVDVELGHDAPAVGFGGLDADAERVRDLLGGLALGDELQHLVLAWRKRIVAQPITALVRLHPRAPRARREVNVAGSTHQKRI